MFVDNALHCFRKLCCTSVWLGTAICRVLSVGQHAVSVCHGSVCSVGPVFLLLVAFESGGIGYAGRRATVLE